MHIRSGRQDRRPAKSVPGVCGLCGAAVVFEWRLDRYWPRLMGLADLARLEPEERAIIAAVQQRRRN